MIGFNLDFVADTSDLDADDSEEEEEVEDVELEGSEIPLGSTTFAACFEARTLQKVCKLMFLKMQPVDIFLRLSHLLPPLQYAVMQFEDKFNFSPVGATRLVPAIKEMG